MQRCVGYSTPTPRGIALDAVKELYIELLLHPQNSPDLAICDFWAFLNFKKRLHGQKYEPRKELRCTVNSNLWQMSRDGQQHVFQSWVELWNNANFARDVTLKSSRGQRYVRLVILVSQNYVTKLLMGLVDPD